MSPTSDPAARQRLEQAFARHQRGELPAAEQSYRSVLAADPRCAYARHMLGVLYLQQGRPAEAVGQLRAAAELEPGNAAVRSNLALALVVHGEFGAALVEADRALALNPAYPEALNNRGNALQALGRPDEALASFERAVALKPDYVDGHYNRGCVAESLGRNDAALAAFDRVVALQPRHVDALHRLANLLRQEGRQQEAISCYDRVLALDPARASALNNRGNALLALGRRVEALDSYDRALAIAPEFADAHGNRGNVLRELGRSAEAVAACDSAIRLAPESAEAYSNRGGALLELGRAEDALADLDRAIALRPDLAPAHANRGNALAELNRHADALVSYDRAIRLDAKAASAHNGRGNVLLSMRRYRDALAAFDAAVAIDLGYADALNNRAFALRLIGRYGDAVAAFDRLLDVAPGYDFAEGNRLNSELHVCDWSRLAEHVERIDSRVREGARAVIPFYYLATSGSSADQLACARTFAATARAPRGSPLWAGERYRHDRIRVAYLSADFHDHATAYLMAGLFEAHDRRRFEVTGISFGPESGGAMRQRLQRGFEHFVEASRWSDREIARWMREHEIDVAVDLKGYTEGSRLGIFVERPAPVQVSYLGYPGTLGLPCLDYVIADPVVIPEGHEGWYTEKVARLPDTYQVNDDRRAIAGETPSRPALGLPDDGFVFCCFNNNYKLLPDVFAIWMRLLRAVPHSVLWLLEGNADAIPNLCAEARRHGVADERLVFAPRAKLEAHLARHRRADLFLDTLPYNAHTTASDALWAGLPVLTRLGTSFAGRVGASLVRAAGMPDLVTGSAQEYETKALAIATTPGLASALRERLQRQRDTCPLFDTRRFARHIESAFETMHRRTQLGLPPEAFDVPVAAAPGSASS